MTCGEIAFSSADTVDKSGRKECRMQFEGSGCLVKGRMGGKGQDKMHKMQLGAVPWGGAKCTEWD